MVLGDVPRSERCRCHETPRKAAGKATTKAAAAPVDDSAMGRFKAWLKQ